MFEKIKERGVSLRAAHFVMVVIAVVVTIVLLVETYLSSQAFKELSGATNEYMELTNSAKELMDASDYLTQEVQSFTITGERAHMNRYFEEAENNRRREKSIDTMMSSMSQSEAARQMQIAMNESLKLMDTEYYAMALVCSVKELTNLPEAVSRTSISFDDSLLSADAKMEKARRMVHDEKYHQAKDVIRTGINGCVNELEKITNRVQDETSAKMSGELLKIRILVIALAVGTIVFLFITTMLGINPLLQGVEKIKEDSEIPVVGAYEFRYLARTYNDMYSAFKQNIANLNYHVSHDKLTGVYNRMGYDILSSNLDFATTTVVMIDVDHFKAINDSHGHDIGDKVLQKLARILRATFRSDDYICRIGGDEFVVFMMYTAEDYKKVLIDKIRRINDALAATKADSLPVVSISAGVVYGKDEVDPSLIMKHVDEALYSMKQRGRKGCYFYV